MTTVYLAIAHGFYDTSDYIIGVYSTADRAENEARKFSALADGRDFAPAIVQSYTVDGDVDVIPPT